jgi:hypothetical protein
MGQVDDDALLAQLHQLEASLRKTNEELRRRCQELEQRLAAPPYCYYDRIVNQIVLEQVRKYVRAVRGVWGA